MDQTGDQQQPSKMTAEEKAKWYDPKADSVVRLVTGMPCSTEDCLNTATIASVSYVPSLRAFAMTPICKRCTINLVGKYKQES